MEYSDCEERFLKKIKESQGIEINETNLLNMNYLIKNILI